jgi:hypothetical protein
MVEAPPGVLRQGQGETPRGICAAGVDGGLQRIGAAAGEDDVPAFTQQGLGAGPADAAAGDAPAVETVAE